MSYNRIQSALGLVGKKRCYSCKKELPEEEFHPSVLKRHIYICKPCQITRSMNWKKNNPLKVKEQRRKYCLKFYEKNGFSNGSAHYKRFREGFIKEANNRCVKCGIPNDNPSFFDLDHIDPTKKKFKNRGGFPSERDNLQVLCPNCHRIKGIENGDLKIRHRF